MIYEIIDDAKISTISFQSNGNDGDETRDSTQSSDMESFDCMQCDEFIAMNQKSLDAHLRSVSSPCSRWIGIVVRFESLE